jgi:hypothetical protein
LAAESREIPLKDALLFLGGDDGEKIEIQLWDPLEVGSMASNRMPGSFVTNEESNAVLVGLGSIILRV